jgi:diguanylate cyclase (GGDEF)-like protein
LGRKASKRDQVKTETAVVIPVRAGDHPDPYLVIMNGNEAGRMFHLGNQATVGRGEECEFHIEDTTVSRKHARFVPKPDGTVEITDLGSTNGTYLKGARIKSAVMHGDDKVQLGPQLILKLSYQDEITERFSRQLFESSVKDGLTGTFNRKAFDDHLAREFAFATRHDKPFSLCLYDVDRFKSVNDTHGHPTGDSVIVRMSQTVTDTLRTEDSQFRLGGDEFALMLRETDERPALVVAKRIVGRVGDLGFLVPGTDQKFSVTISMGLVTLKGKNFPDTDSLINAADERLYQAKDLGGNRVVGSEKPKR